MAQASTARGGAIADAVLMASWQRPLPVAVHANASASAQAVAHEQEGGESRAMQKHAQQEGVRTELQWP